MQPLNILQAIAKEEGFYTIRSRASRNNNPGNIEWGKFAQAHGATKVETIPQGIEELPRFAYFPTVAVGFAAMKALLKAPAYTGFDVAQTITKWAPPPENDTPSYIKNVCSSASCSPTTSLSSLLYLIPD